MMKLIVVDLVVEEEVEGTVEGTVRSDLIVFRYVRKGDMSKKLRRIVVKF